MTAKHTAGVTILVNLTRRLKTGRSRYIERMERYFVTDEVTSNAKKKAIILSMCGSPTYTAPLAV